MSAWDIGALSCWDRRTEKKPWAYKNMPIPILFKHVFWAGSRNMDMNEDTIHCVNHMSAWDIGALVDRVTKKGTMDLQQHAHSCTPNIYQACYISSWAPYRVVMADRKKQGLTSLPMSWYCLQNNQFITVWDLAFLVVKSIVKTLTIYHSLIIWKCLMACYGSLRLW